VTADSDAVHRHAFAGWPPDRMAVRWNSWPWARVPAGPSGSPLRGLVNVLPTGRNFYSVDPRAVPSRLAWETGQAMADSLLERYLADTGTYPDSVGLSVWGTASMRTSGDDVAEVLALSARRSAPAPPNPTPTTLPTPTRTSTGPCP
jgi:cobaltochelatase CobN